VLLREVKKVLAYAFEVTFFCMMLLEEVKKVLAHAFEVTFFA